LDDPSKPFPDIMGIDCEKLCTNQFPDNFWKRRECVFACQAFYAKAPNHGPIGQKFLDSFCEEFKDRFKEEVKKICARFDAPGNNSEQPGQN
jgi:hypothetical protein